MKARRISYGLCTALVLYVAFRALILLTNFEEVVMPMFELFPMGTMAEAKLRGVHYPMRFYYDNAAGQLVMGHAAIPMYWLFGSSYFVLKLLPALLGVVTLVFLWMLLDRHFSRLAANIGALLFVFAPSTIVRYSVVCSGNHFENLLFTTIFLWAFYRHHGVARTRWSLFLAWYSAGFALFVFLGALIPVGICAGMHVGLRGLKRTLMDAPIALSGFVLGLMPLIAINAATSGRGLGFLSAKFAEEGGRKTEQTTIERTGDFLGQGLVESGMFETQFGIDGATWSIVFIAVFALAYVVSLPSTLTGISRLIGGTFSGGTTRSDADAAFERVKLVPFVLYLPLAAVAFGIADFRLRGYQHPMLAGGYRYYLPTLLFALVLIAVWTARWWHGRGALRVGSVVLGGSALASGATSLALVDWSFSNVGSGLHYDGYNFAHMSRNLVTSRNAVPRDEMIWRIQTWPKEVQALVVRGLGQNLTFEALFKADPFRKPDWTLDLDLVMRDFPPEWRPIMANGAGVAVRFMLQGRAQVGRLPEFLRHVRAQDEALVEQAVAGSACPTVNLPMGREVFDTFSENLSLLTMDTPHMDAFARGHGSFCGRVEARGIAHEVRFVREFRTRFDSPPFGAGWQSGAGGTQH